MFVFSKTAPVSDLIADIKALPAATAQVDAEFVSAVKALAIARLRLVKEPSAAVNIRAHVIPVLSAQQVEIQITGRKS